MLQWCPSNPHVHQPPPVLPIPTPAQCPSLTAVCGAWRTRPAGRGGTTTQQGLGFGGGGERENNRGAFERGVRLTTDVDWQRVGLVSKWSMLAIVH